MVLVKMYLLCWCFVVVWVLLFGWVVVVCFVGWVLFG